MTILLLKRLACTWIVSLSLLGTVDGFSPLKKGTETNRNQHQILSSSSGKAAAPVFSALSREEMEAILNKTPVYAVTEKDRDGVVLLQEQDNENQIAYFFHSPESANSVFAPLRSRADSNSIWEVTQFPLGLIWFELFCAQDTNGVEYRLVPDTKYLQQAKGLLETNPDAPQDLFQKPYNEIPVFVDPSLRVESDSMGEQVPMYLSLDDILATCQRAMDGAPEDYKPNVSVTDLVTLMHQMQEDSNTDFRKIRLIPPTPDLVSTPNVGGTLETNAPLNTPFADGDSWSD